MTTDLPAGCTQPLDHDTLLIEFGDYSLDFGCDELCIEWTETRDDHFGTTNRRALLPLSVVRAMLARVEVSDE